ncbi:TfuA-like protein [Streptomyces sp. NPDC002467]|uniref:TfuA-like protein n=1 Tax=Streptomyces sp. NPDC002467 TaxID=3364647 RepID=UPI0036AB575F
MIHVFTGPTLAPSEVALGTPQLRVLPPARHGDLDDPAIETGHTVVLIDGVYHQAPALRHKEIRAAIAQGVRVIGALRAAELHGHGMIGPGRIYGAYRRGALTGDDEVAVGQAPDGDLHAHTWPLVNIRHILQSAERESQRS